MIERSGSRCSPVHPCNRSDDRAECQNELVCPVRFAATKLIEKDPLIEKALALSDDNRSAFDQIVSVMEKDSGLDREAALANMRFSFLENLCSTTVVRPHESKEHKRSMAIDRF